MIKRKARQKSESLLESTAEAIGSTLGRLARQIGLSQPATAEVSPLRAKKAVGQKRAAARRRTSPTSTDRAPGKRRRIAGNRTAVSRPGSKSTH